MKKIKRICSMLLCLCLLVCGAADLIPSAQAVSAMTASDACVALIKEFEGFSAKPYYDYSQYTIGYGTKCPVNKFNEYSSNGISQSDADALLQNELADIAYALNSKLIDKYNLALTQQQFDALVSFSFNIGTGWVTYDSTLRNAILRNADANDLVYAFGLYCTAGGKYLPGLVSRRLCEANLYLNGVYSKKLSDDFGYVYYDANGGSVTYRVQGFLCDSRSAPAADATRSGETFLGWFTELNGGTQVTTLSRELTGKTLFARWQTSENTDDQTTASTTIRVTGDVVNIRSGPGTNYGITKRVYRNTVLTVSHVTHLTNMKWGKVQDGWICLDYTNYDAVTGGANDTDTNTEINDTPSVDVTVPDSTPEWNDTVTDTIPDTQTAVTGTVNVNDFLNIRSGPGTAYATVGFLFRGTKVSILEQRSAGTSVWGRMEKGWVCMDYIVTGQTSSGGTVTPETKPEQESGSVQDTTNSGNPTEAVSIKGKITADALRIRSSAGTNSTIVGFYYQNDTVTITEKVLVGSVYWGKTGKGWISMEYVQADSTAGETAPPAGNGTKTVIGDVLRIRQEPGIVYKIVGFLYYGDKVSILETTDVNGTAWGRVDKGWICMDYVN